MTAAVIDLLALVCVGNLWIFLLWQTVWGTSHDREGENLLMCRNLRFGTCLSCWREVFDSNHSGYPRVLGFYCYNDYIKLLCLKWNKLGPFIFFNKLPMFCINCIIWERMCLKGFQLCRKKLGWIIHLPCVLHNVTIVLLWKGLCSFEDLM